MWINLDQRIKTPCAHMPVVCMSYSSRVVFLMRTRRSFPFSNLLDLCHSYIIMVVLLLLRLCLLIGPLRVNKKKKLYIYPGGNWLGDLPYPLTKNWGIVSFWEKPVIRIYRATTNYRYPFTAGWTGAMCILFLAQGNYAVPLVRLEPTTLRSEGRRLIH